MVVGRYSTPPHALEKLLHLRDGHTATPKYVIANM